METKKTSGPYAVELLNITKYFGTEKANDNVTLRLKKGEIHALLGENGAGKSTLMNVLFGMITPDGGEIRVKGESVTIKNPNDAASHGIGMVHQHFKLIGIYSVLDNIILGCEPNRCGVLTKKAAREKIMALSEKYGLSVDTDAKVSDITVGMQQRTEILKMLYRDNDVLIFDEPTAVLTPQEIDGLMDTMRSLADKGCSILFITHHLDEIMRVADRVTVLSQGRCIGTAKVKDITKEKLSEMMIGREIKTAAEKKPCVPGETVLLAENVRVAQKGKKGIRDIGFSVRAGEIVCIAGIDGNGQHELIGGITGLLPVKSGRITLCGKDITDAPIRFRSMNGMSHIPEDRLKHALVHEFSVEDNLILQRYFDRDFTGAFGFLDRGRIRRFAEELMERFDVRALSGASAVSGSLSGGNQQKLVIARELEKAPKLLIAVQPVRGLDIGAVSFIHEKLLECRDAGMAILLVSFDVEEVFGLADRILVMYEGRITAKLDPKTTSVKELGLYMAGGKTQKEGE